MALPSEDLIDSLFPDTECLDETGPGLPCFVACPDFFTAGIFLRRVVCARTRRNRYVDVHEHHPVTNRVPKMSESPGFAPLEALHSDKPPHSAQAQIVVESFANMGLRSKNTL
jgi:hypothetical protein